RALDILGAADREEVVLLVVIERRFFPQPTEHRVRIGVDFEVVRVVVHGRRGLLTSSHRRRRLGWNNYLVNARRGPDAWLRVPPATSSWHRQLPVAPSTSARPRPATRRGPTARPSSSPPTSRRQSSCRRSRCRPRSSARAASIPQCWARSLAA